MNGVDTMAMRMARDGGRKGPSSRLHAACHGIRASSTRLRAAAPVEPRRIGGAVRRLLVCWATPVRAPRTPRTMDRAETISPLCRGALPLRLYFFASFAALGVYSPFFPRWLVARGVEGISLGAVAATL